MESAGTNVLRCLVRPVCYADVTLVQFAPLPVLPGGRERHSGLYRPTGG
jgi:hypothetical protein